MSSKSANQMAEDELAEYYFDHRDDPGMVGGRVDYVPPRSARVAVRLSLEEERRIRQAAQDSGMTVSAFLRQVGLAAASTGAVDLDRLRRDVEEAHARIEDARRALA